ncbi:MAG: hypothetical protein H7838_07460 [Magnetococcus sp. DMHC-8]
MFRVSKEQTFSWPVVVTAPADGIQQEIGRFNARFRLLSIDEAAESADVARGGGDELLLEKILVGWDEVQTEDGQDFPFFPENRRILTGNPCVRAAIFRAYFHAASGGAREKN